MTRWIAATLVRHGGAAWTLRVALADIARALLHPAQLRPSATWPRGWRVQPQDGTMGGLP